MKKFTLTTPIPQAVSEALSTFHPLVQHILYRAGVEDLAQAKAFLAPEYTKLSDPSLFADMDRATSRLVAALKNSEHIGIYADYDADGIPGACILNNTLRACGIPEEKITVYIPHRHYEGYGVHRTAVEELQSKGVQLLLTVDVGITEYETLTWLQQQGIDVIVTDHHEMPVRIPEVLAVIHPARDPYPDAKLCGAAVAFQLMRSLIQTLQTAKDIPEYITVPHIGWEKWLLDLVGLATLSDMVPLVGENRIFAWYGMQVMAKTRNYGLKAIMDHQRLRPHFLTETDVVFSITPRLNAASRMDHPMRAFDLLQSDNAADALTATKFLESLNTKRKTTVARIMKIVHDRLGKRTHLPEVVVVGERTWEQGVLGLIASKITETYNVAAFVWSEQSEGMIKGSCRSANGIHLVELMRSVPTETWHHFGGHAGAGGFALDVKDLLHLEETLNTGLKNKRKEVVIAVDEEITIDAILKPVEITPILYATLRSCAPFGVGNPSPVIAVEGYIHRIEMFGKAKEHLKLVLWDQQGNQIEAVAFYRTVDDLSYSPPKSAVENPDTTKVYVIGSIEQDTFGYKKQLRMRLDDVVEVVYKNL